MKSLKSLKRLKTLTGIGLLVAAGSLGTGGCAFNTPAYTAEERNAQIARNQRYESEQLIDDFDHLLLLRPASRLTIWNLAGD